VAIFHVASTGSGLMRPQASRRGRLALVLAAAAATLAWARAPTPQDPLRLVVVITVDQMPAEMLERFGPYFSGGFTRLLRGAVFSDAHHDHANTVTAVGHATISTGTFPAHHGIVGNEYYDRTVARVTYCADDSTAPILGSDSAPGRSPRNLLRSTLGDWLKAVSPESKVFGLAIKDRSAILTAGARADGAYWYSDADGRFVTSAYYMDGYPDWVQTFNGSGRVEQYRGQQWQKLLSDDAYAVSREDSFPAEFDGQHTTFPHAVGATDRAFYSELPYTPFGDEVTLAFAHELVVHETLGLDDAPDILFLGLSTPDFVGHRYGPYSQEVEDLYLRLDRGLEAFFTFLDERVGADRYAVALSADHGVLALPEELVRRGIDAGRLDSRTLFAGLRDAVVRAAQDSLITELPRLRWVNGIVITFASGSPDASALTRLRWLIAEALESNEGVVHAFTFDSLARVDIRAAGVTGRFRRNFYPDRSADVVLHLKEYYTRDARGATHGSAYDYDTHVPLLFLGPGIMPGRYDQPTRTVDLAPTLAALLGVTPPDDVDGRALVEALGAR